MTREPRVGVRRAPLLAAAIALLSCACGGKASTKGEPSDLATEAGGASPRRAGGDGEGFAPSSTVSETGTNQVVTDSDATPECLQGFQGFQATLGDRSVDFKAFVAAPGDYAGDPVHILWLDVRHPDGSHFLASTGSANSGGEIALHVDAVEPRFQGKLTAVLVDQSNADAATLTLQLAFDIAVRVGCN